MENNIMLCIDNELMELAVSRVLELNFPSLTGVPIPKGNRELLFENPEGLLLLMIEKAGDEESNMIKDLKRDFKKMKIIILSTIYEDQALAVSYLRMGVHGFVHMKSSVKELVEAIDMVLTDRRYIDASVQKVLFEEFLRPQKAARVNNSLSERQNEILKAVLNGETTTHIANKFGIKPSTVSSTKKNIYNKMNVKNYSELIKRVRNDNQLKMH